MPGVECLTIDVTVARDLLESDRLGHHLALELFALARRGEVELATAPQGYRLDVQGDLAKQVRKAFRNERVADARQLAYPSPATFPGPDLFPGAFVPGFGDAWAAVLATWNGPGTRPEGNDALHVETHVLEKRDLLITDDVGMLTMCRRLRDEHDIELEAMGLKEYLDRRRDPASLRPTGLTR